MITSPQRDPGRNSGYAASTIGIKKARERNVCAFISLSLAQRRRKHIYNTLFAMDCKEKIKKKRNFFPLGD